MMIEQRRCKLCGGLLCLLGVLGRLTWFRCRACGMQFSVRKDVCEYCGGPHNVDDNPYCSYNV